MYSNSFKRTVRGTPCSRTGLLPQIGPVLTLLLAALASVRAGESPTAGQELLRLVPPGASVVLTVDDLRGQVHDPMASKLIQEALELPSVKSWFQGEKYREFQESRERLEEVFQTTLPEIRDRIFGDAVVLAIELPDEAHADPARARGLLLLKASDPPLLRKLVDALNAIQKNNGEVTDIEERSWHKHTYQVRSFAPGASREADAYTIFPDGTFAVSNSPDSIQHVIDAKASDGGRAGTSATEQPAIRFRAVQEKLAKRAAARLFIDTRAVSELLKKSSSSRSPFQALIERHIASLQSAGAALVVRDGRIALEVAEVYEPDRFGGIFGDPTKSAGDERAARLAAIPEGAPAAGQLHLDFPAIYESLARLVPEEDRPRLANIEAILRGLSLGADFRTKVLPSLGPEVLAFVGTPNPGDAGSTPGRSPFPLGILLRLKDGPASDSTPGQQVSIPSAVDNALSTLLAVVALDEKHGKGRARVVSREAFGLTIKSLDPALPFAFAVDHRNPRLIVGDSPETIERIAGQGPGGPDAPGIRRIQSLAFPNAQSFACLDLAAVRSYFMSHRDSIVELISRRENRDRDQVARDLEDVAALAKLFEGVYWSCRVDRPSSTALHQIGLLSSHARPGDTPPGP